MGHARVLLHNVIPQLIRSRETLRALGAHERSLPCVRSMMPLQVRQSQERQVAIRALMWFQSGMRLHVAPKVLFVEERALTRWTLDGAGQANFVLGLDKCLEIDL